MRMEARMDQLEQMLREVIHDRENTESEQHEVFINWKIG